jgi:hypothetical protein
VTLYAITGWTETFETCETRKLDNLRWWPKPNKHDGLGFKRMAAQRDRSDLYAAWTLMGDIASRTLPADDRGKLIRSGRPLTAEDLALMTGFPEAQFERAFNFFSSPEVGWLTVLDFEPEQAPNRSAVPAARPTIPEARAASPDKTGTDPGRPGSDPAVLNVRKEGREGKGSSPTPVQDKPEQINVVVYPQPDFGHLPKPLYASTAKKLLEAVDTQIAECKRLAQARRIPVMERTSEGTEYRTGWRYPSEAANAIRQWEKRKADINAALAGAK